MESKITNTGKEGWQFQLQKYIKKTYKVDYWDLDLEDLVESIRKVAKEQGRKEERERMFELRESLFKLREATMFQADDITDIDEAYDKGARETYESVINLIDKILKPEKQP